MRTSELIGAKLGDRFVIERELGRGGMGVVYLAHDKPQLHSRPVVVKVLLQEAMKNDWVVKKFQQEIESLTRVDDPGIVGIFDAGALDDGTPYIVMQYIDGVTLRTLIDQDGMNLELTAHIIKQIGRTITAAHQAGVLHRDLKPENIMLRKGPDGNYMIKVIDFGIAKVRNSVAGPTTSPGITAGTIGYMSPEQLGAKPVSIASDIYSLGVIAYEMVTGRRPFNPESIFQLLEMERAGVKVRPVDLRPGLPIEAQDIILKALSFDSDSRFSSAQEFGDQLAGALSPLDVQSDNRKTLSLNKREIPTEIDTGVQTVIQPGRDDLSNKTKPMPETAHVLFTDIVGYSKLLIDEQSERLEELQNLVRSTDEFKRAEAAGQLLRLPTGDGMALSFFGDPEAPVRCAVEISRLLKSHPGIMLRMGVNSGFVYRVADINRNLNVAGGGINMAQRVMDCGDAGHILLSKRVADDIGQLGRWANSLHDLGEAEVKHGVRVHVVNLYADDYGNPAIPEKLRKKHIERNPWRRRILYLGATLAIALFVITGFFLINSALNPSRSFRYSIIVQEMQKDKDGKYVPLGDEFPSTGDEFFGNGWKFRIRFTAPQPGSLYVLDKGPVNYNVLFPTPKANNGLAKLSAGDVRETGWLVFDNNTGNEKLELVWSEKPLEQLESIFKDAASHGLIIDRPDQIKTVENLLEAYGSNPPNIVSDKLKDETTVQAKSRILVRELILKHKDY